MKKLFSKIETKIDNTSKETNNYVGKVFTVGRVTVTVEDVLAEGNFLYFNNVINYYCYYFFALIPLLLQLSSTFAQCSE